MEKTFLEKSPELGYGVGDIVRKVSGFLNSGLGYCTKRQEKRQDGSSD